jgi:hypothetical protein
MISSLSLPRALGPGLLLSTSLSITFNCAPTKEILLLVITFPISRPLAISVRLDSEGHLDANVRTLSLPFPSLPFPSLPFPSHFCSSFLLPIPLFASRAISRIPSRRGVKKTANAVGPGVVTQGIQVTGSGSVTRPGKRKRSASSSKKGASRANKARKKKHAAPSSSSEGGDSDAEMSSTLTSIVTDRDDDHPDEVRAFIKPHFQRLPY